MAPLRSVYHGQSGMWECPPFRQNGENFEHQMYTFCLINLKQRVLYGRCFKCSYSLIQFNVYLFIYLLKHTFFDNVLKHLRMLRSTLMKFHTIVWNTCTRKIFFRWEVTPLHLTEKSRVSLFLGRSVYSAIRERQKTRGNWELLLVHEGRARKNKCDIPVLPRATVVNRRNRGQQRTERCAVCSVQCWSSIGKNRLQLPSVKPLSYMEKLRAEKQPGEVVGILLCDSLAPYSSISSSSIHHTLSEMKLTKP